MRWWQNLSQGRKIVWSIALVYVVGLIGFVVAFGIKGHKNESFKVIDSFHLESWFKIAGPLQFDKGVLYLLLATIITLGDHAVCREPHAKASRTPAGGRGGRVRAHVAGDARQHER